MMGPGARRVVTSTGNCLLALVLDPVVTVFVPISNGVLPVKRASEVLYDRLVRLAEVRHQLTIPVSFRKVGNGAAHQMNTDSLLVVQRVYPHPPAVVPRSVLPVPVQPPCPEFQKCMEDPSHQGVVEIEPGELATRNLVSY